MKAAVNKLFAHLPSSNHSPRLLAKNVEALTFEFGGSNIDLRTYFQDFWYLLRDFSGYRFFRITQLGYFVPIKEYGEFDAQILTTNYFHFSGRNVIAAQKDKIHCIVFSKDRALQLDATLRSFFLHCADAAQVTVLYKTSSPRHAAQYQRLQNHYPGVKFVEEKDFRSDLLDLLNPHPAKALLYRLAFHLSSFGFRPGTRLDQLVRTLIDPPRFFLNKRLFPAPEQPAAILFLVDDNLFVRDFSLADCITAISQRPDALGFSLRLGRNTIYSYMTDQPQPLPQFSENFSSPLLFQWTGSSLDFGYPLELSSSIYQLSVILPLLLSISFRNPNQMESALSLRTGLFRRSHPKLLCFEQSVTFCNPVNVVQAAQANRSGNIYSADELADRFERGERLDVASYDGFTPNACHQEVELRFIHPELP